MCDCMILNVGEEVAFYPLIFIVELLRHLTTPQDDIIHNVILNGVKNLIFSRGVY